MALQHLLTIPMLYALNCRWRLPWRVPAWRSWTTPCRWVLDALRQPSIMISLADSHTVKLIHALLLLWLHMLLASCQK